MCLHVPVLVPGLDVGSARAARSPLSPVSDIGQACQHHHSKACMAAALLEQCLRRAWLFCRVHRNPQGGPSSTNAAACLTLRDPIVLSEGPINKGGPQNRGLIKVGLLTINATV